jgi:hypothetical protein
MTAGSPRHFAISARYASMQNRSMLIASQKQRLLFASSRSIINAFTINPRFYHVFLKDFTSAVSVLLRYRMLVGMKNQSTFAGTGRVSAPLRE